MQSLGHGEKLTRMKEQAIAALLGCGSVTQAAAQLGVCRQTLSRWLENPEFAAEFRRAKQELGQEMLLKLQVSGPRTVDRASTSWRTTRPPSASSSPPPASSWAPPSAPSRSTPSKTASPPWSSVSTKCSRPRRPPPHRPPPRRDLP